MSASFTPAKLVEGVYRPALEEDEFNVSNSNAASILASLGLDPNFNECPPYSLEQFEAECATFLRIASGTEVDAGLPEIRSGNLVTCGRRDGYVTDKVTGLLELARKGLSCGATHMCVS